MRHEDLDQPRWTKSWYIYSRRSSAGLESGPVCPDGSGVAGRNADLETTGGIRQPADADPAGTIHAACSDLCPVLKRPADFAPRHFSDRRGRGGWPGLGAAKGAGFGASTDPNLEGS